jgi:hypothetical protein
MSEALITCPSTGKTIRTGVHTDKRTWDSTTVENNRAKCEHCGEVHVWSKKDARLSDD